MLISLGAASASDINNTVDDQVLSATPNTDTVSASVNLEQDNDTLSVQNDKNLLSAGINDNSGNNNLNSKLMLNNNENKLTAGVAGSYDELQYLIKLTDAGQSILLDKDYTYSSSDSITVLTINKELTIDGNGFTISGAGIASAFSITGDGVTLKNLNIINMSSLSSTPIISWNGNDGELSNTTLTQMYGTRTEQVAYNSGNVIEWTGNGAKLYNITYTDPDIKLSSSRYCSAFYFTGVNVEIRDCNFTNIAGYSDDDHKSYHRILFLNSAAGVNILTNCKFYNVTTAASGTNNGGLIFARACTLDVDYCRFINCTSASAILFLQGTPTVSNSWFENNGPAFDVNNKLLDTYAAKTGANINADSSTIINCDFVKSRGLFTVSAGVVYDSRFIDCGPVACTVKSIVRCNFTNMNAGMFWKNSYNNPASFKEFGSLNMTGNRFVNCNVDNFTKRYDINIQNGFNNSAFININSGEHHSIYDNVFVDCKAVESIVTLQKDITVNYNNNTFSDCINSTNDTITEILDKDSKSFTLITTLYVSDTPNGTGDSRNTSTTLVDALNRIDTGGKIIIINGTHNFDDLEDIDYTIRSDIIGENNVVINCSKMTHGFAINAGVTVKDVTFTDFDVVSSYKSGGIDIQCGAFRGGRDNTFTNVNITNSTFRGSVFTRPDDGMTFNNLRITNSTTNLIFYYLNSGNSRVYIDFNVNGLVIDNCTNVNLLSINSFVRSSVHDVEIKNSTITTLINYPGGVIYQSNIYDINVLDCNVTQQFYNSGSNGNYNTFTIKDFTANNFTFKNTESKWIFQAYNTVFDNLNINTGNLSNISNLLLAGKNSVVKNSNIQNVFNSDNLRYLGRVVISSKFENVTFDHCVNFNGIIVENSEVDDLHVLNSNFNTSALIVGDYSRLSNSELKNVVANASVNVTGYNVNINNIEFNKNTVVNGSLFINGENCFIDSCTFINNTAKENAGAIYVNVNSTQIMTSTFNNNTAGNHGGAIFIIPKVSCYIDDTCMNQLNEELENESVKVNGLYRVGYLPTYTDVYVNSTLDHDHDNYRSTLAGAFSLVNPNGRIIFLVENDNFTFNEGQYAFAKSNVTIIGCNTNAYIKGFIHICPYGNNLTVKYVNFYGAPDHALLWEGDNGKIINCTFHDNIASADNSYGIALDIEAKNMEIINTTFKNNVFDTASSIGGVIYFNSTGLNITNCTFDGNVANVASSIYATENSRYLNINNTTFINSKKFNNLGSSILVMGRDVSISNSTFENNTEISESVIKINNIVSTVNLNDNIFKNNSAVDGGAILINQASIVNINNNTFELNNATNGGALYVNSGSVTLNDDNTFKNNSAVYGGAVYANSPVTIDDSTFTGNNATYGGAVYANAAVTIDGSIFTGNNATCGGALYLNTDGSVLSNSGFTLNTAENGSAIYIADKKATIYNVTVDQNGVDNQVFGDIYLGEGSLFIPNDDLVLGKLNDRDQFIYVGDYTSDVLYISPSGDSSATGLTSNLATTLDHAIEHILNGGKIIAVGDDDTFTYNKITFNNNTNVTIVGNGKKFKINNPDKYLFNPLKKIKNLSLNNYLSSQSLKIKKIKNVQNKYFH